MVQHSGISMTHSLPGTERSGPLCTGSGTNNHLGKGRKVVCGAELQKPAELENDWMAKSFGALLCLDGAQNGATDRRAL